MIRCIDAVREHMRRETGLSLTDAQIEQMLAGGPCSLGDTVREIVRQQGRAYTERLFALVTEAGFDLRALPTVMLGGGAGIVQRHVGPKRRPVPRDVSAGRQGKRGRVRARVGAAFGPCERGVNRPPRPQFVFRPNLRCEDDRRAWQLFAGRPGRRPQGPHRPRPAAKRARTPAGRSGAQDRAGGTGKNANRFCRPAAARQQRNPKGGVGFFSNIVIKIEGSGSHAVIKRAQTRLCGLLLLLAFRCNSQ